MLKSLTYLFILLFKKGVVAQVNLSQKLMAYYPIKGNAEEVSLSINNGTVYGVDLTTNTIETNLSKIAAKEFSYFARVYPSVLPGSGTGAILFATGSFGRDSFCTLFRDFYGLRMFSYSALCSTGIRIVWTFKSMGYGR